MIERIGGVGLEDWRQHGTFERTAALQTQDLSSNPTSNAFYLCEVGQVPQPPFFTMRRVMYMTSEGPSSC